MRNNIFCIGGQVEGDSFIGRNAYVAQLRNAFIKSNVKTSVSIIGLTRTGKSSVVFNAFKGQRLLEQNIIYINEALGEFSYREMWQHIVREIAKQLNKIGLINVELYKMFSKIDNDSLKWIDFNETLKEIFEYLKEQELKTILVLDEFDKAESIFENDTKKFELLRNLLSAPKYNIFGIIISRRNLYEIEGTTYMSSTFHGVLEPIYLKGFNVDDMKEYYSKLNGYEISLTEEQKKEIIYYTGYSPYLLSIFGNKIVERVWRDKNQQHVINVSEIFFEDCKLINDYYRDIIRHLDRDGDLKRLIPFVIGPNVGVTQNDKYELMNLGYLRIEDDEIVAISRCFIDFLSYNQLNNSIWELIITTEMLLKQLLEKEMVNLIKAYKVFGSSLSEIEKNILLNTQGITNNDIIRYDKFIINNKHAFNQISTYFDVMSFADSIKIITQCWLIFSKYFGMGKLADWKVKFKQCSDARNPIAHGHEEYITEIQKKEVDLYCKEIIDSINKSKCLNQRVALSENDIVKLAAVYKK